jgi:hypothetical protein
MSAQNPYAPPSARIDDVVEVVPEQEEIRRSHIKHEASIRSIGLLYLFGGALAIVGAGSALLAPWSGGPTDLLTIMATVYVVVGVVTIATGYGMRRLQPWARVVAIVLSLLGLLGFPIGTLIHGYFLYLLLSAKGRRIFEPDYADIVAATPHIKYRTSIIVWVLLAILLLGIGAAILIPLMAP